MFYFFFHLKTLIIRDENLLSPPQRIPNPEMKKKKKKRGVAIILKILYVYIYIYCMGIGIRSSLCMYILGLGPNLRTKNRPKRSKHCQGSPC